MRSRHGKFGLVFYKGHDAGHFTDHVDEVGAGGHHYLGVMFQGGFHGLQFAEQLGVADKVFFSGLVHEPDGLGIAFRRQDFSLPGSFGLLDRGAAFAVGDGLGGGGEVNRGDFLVLGFDHLVHGFLHVARGINLLQFRPYDIDTPVDGFGLQRGMQSVVNFTALAVGGAEGQRANDVAERGARQVDNLVGIIKDLVLGIL